MKNPMNELLERIENAKANVAIYNLILPILEPFDGKKITKRMNTKVNEALTALYTNYTSWYDVSYGMFYINIRGRKHEMRILLGYASTPIFNFQEFKNRNQGYSLDNKRLIKYEQAIPKIAEWEQKINAIKAQVKELKGEIEGYGCQYYFDWDWRYLP
jgi:hypothetical protein